MTICIIIMHRTLVSEIEKVKTICRFILSNVNNPFRTINKSRESPVYRAFSQLYEILFLSHEKKPRRYYDKFPLFFSITDRITFVPEFYELGFACISFIFF